ncbi:hypothetical protein [Aquimarina rhabdastrellae]
MSDLINVYDTNKIVEKSTGIYSIYIIGGWDIDLGDFDIILKNVRTNKIVTPKKSKWRLQSYEFNQKAKKIMSINIPERGEYQIIFKNIDSLKVWNFDFPYLGRLFIRPKAHHLISIYIC